MASWRRFQPRVIDVEALRDTGTKWERGGGFPFNWVGLCNQPETGVRARGFGRSQVPRSRQSRKAGWGVYETSVPETDTGGRGEQPQVNE